MTKLNFKKKDERDLLKFGASPEIVEKEFRALVEANRGHLELAFSEFISGIQREITTTKDGATPGVRQCAKEEATRLLNRLDYILNSVVQAQLLSK